METQSHTAWYDAAEELLNNLGSQFSKRAFDFDSNCRFVQNNYDDLKEARFFSLAIPVELGGGGLTYTELCQITQQLAQHCGSTALAFAPAGGVTAFLYCRSALISATRAARHAATDSRSRSL